eukprot:s588_g10.t1
MAGRGNTGKLADRAMMVKGFLERVSLGAAASLKKLAEKAPDAATTMEATRTSGFLCCMRSCCHSSVSSIELSSPKKFICQPLGSPPESPERRALSLKYYLKSPTQSLFLRWMGGRCSAELADPGVCSIVQQASSPKAWIKHLSWSGSVTNERGAVPRGTARRSDAGASEDPSDSDSEISASESKATPRQRAKDFENVLGRFHRDFEPRGPSEASPKPMPATEALFHAARAGNYNARASPDLGLSRTGSTPDTKPHTAAMWLKLLVSLFLARAFAAAPMAACDDSGKAVPMETDEHPSARTQVLVVGGGLAGLTATIEAARAGAMVTIIDKEAQLGGNSAKASSGMNGAGTEAQKELGIRDSVDQFVEDTLSSGDGLSRRKLVETLARLGLTDVVQLGGHSTQRTHRFPHSAEGKPQPVGWTLISSLRKIIETDLKDSVRVHTKSAFQEGLIMEGRRAVGLKYSDEAGTTHSLFGTVVLAAGGYANDHQDRSLLDRFTPELAKLPTTNGPFATGDVIKALLQQDLGAQTTLMDKVQIHPTGFLEVKQPNFHTKFLAPEALRGCGAILLCGGKRFANELGRRDYLTKEVFEHCTPLQGNPEFPIAAAMLLTQEAVDKYGASSMGFYKFKGLVEGSKLRDRAWVNTFAMAHQSQIQLRSRSRTIDGTGSTGVTGHVAPPPGLFNAAGAPATMPTSQTLLLQLLEEQRTQNQLIANQLSMMHRAQACATTVYTNPDDILNHLDPSLKLELQEWSRGRVITAPSYTSLFKSEARELTECLATLNDGENDTFADVRVDGTPFNLDDAYRALRKKHADECQAFVFAYQRQCLDFFRKRVNVTYQKVLLDDRFEAWCRKFEAFLSADAKVSLQRQVLQFADLTFRTEQPKAMNRQEKERANRFLSADAKVSLQRQVLQFADLTFRTEQPKAMNRQEKERANRIKQKEELTKAEAEFRLMDVQKLLAMAVLEHSALQIRKIFVQSIAPVRSQEVVEKVVDVVEEKAKVSEVIVIAAE